MPNRLARPGFSEDGVAIENEFTNAGVTVVFSTRVSRPRRPGRRDLGETIVKHIDYEKGGAYLDDLAVRVIEKQRSLAVLGYWTGGPPPYPFKRVRVLADGSEVDLPDGRSTREPGSHTELRIASPEHLSGCLLIHDLCVRHRWGPKRIANELTNRGIPSPDAGRTRTENGHPHRVSGRWHANTVRSILRDKRLIAILNWGLRSEGEHRRLGKDGPRFLEDSDFADGDKLKIIKNPEGVVVTAPLRGVEPVIAPEMFDECQRILDERGKNQRGIPKSKDLAKYPMSTRVFDMGCAWPMYGRTSGSRKVHECGLYLRDGSCHHNAVDAEALLQFTWTTLRQVADVGDSRNALVQSLQELAQAQMSRQTDPQVTPLQALESRRGSVRQELDLIAANLARAKSDREYEAISVHFHEKNTERERLDREIQVGRSKAEQQAHFNPMIEVEAALSRLDDMKAILTNPEARLEFRQLLEHIYLNVWLHFDEGRKGTRPIRVLKGALITTGNAPFPVRPYERGLENLDSNNNSGRVSSPLAATADVPPAGNPNPREGISYTKVNRGD